MSYSLVYLTKHSEIDRIRCKGFSDTLLGGNYLEEFSTCQASKCGKNALFVTMEERLVFIVEARARFPPAGRRAMTARGLEL